MKQLKWRFIAGAMVAFTILLVLIIGGIVIFGQIQMESESDAFIDWKLKEFQSSEHPSRSPGFGFHAANRNISNAYFDLQVDADGKITAQKAIGIIDQENIDLEAMVAQILKDRNDRGKVGVYKFGKAEMNGGIRIILTDNIIQLQTMYSIARSAILVGLFCLVLMFVILQPIGHYIARENLSAREREQQFITNASHELKTPVAVIQSNIEAMEMMQGENKWSRNVHHQVIRLNHMISQMLLMERIDEQRLKQKPVTVDLGSLVRDVSDEMRELTEQRLLRMNVQCEKELPVNGYGEALRQLLGILLDNAARYSSQESEILLKLTAQKREAVLNCENRVDSLPAVAPGQLFERFHRGGITRQPGDLGCGIGLSAAADIVAMHHGHIEASYPDGHTFRITVRIPKKT